MLTALVLLFGIVACIAIVLTAKQCRCKREKKTDDSSTACENELDPWKEAANRLKSDLDELE